MSTKTVVHQIVTFRDVIGTRNLITATVGPNLEPIILSLGQSPDYRRKTTGASFPKQMASRRNNFRIHYCVGNEWFSIDLEPTNENYHSVQPLGMDEWLLVRGRSKSDDDPNAHVYGGDGKVRRSFPAGDGIQDVQATRDGRIWISSFDEGVFSGVQIGRTGLICLDRFGNKVHDFAMIAGEAGSIADCYALNVCSNDDTCCTTTQIFLSLSSLMANWRNVGRAFPYRDLMLLPLAGNPMPCLRETTATDASCLTFIFRP